MKTAGTETIILQSDHKLCFVLLQVNGGGVSPSHKFLLWGKLSRSELKWEGIEEKNTENCSLCGISQSISPKWIQSSVCVCRSTGCSIIYMTRSAHT